MAREFISLSLEEQYDLMKNLGQPRFRVDQINRWIYGNGVLDWADMTDVPKGLQHQLQEVYPRALLAEVISTHVSPWAVKYALRLHDGEVVETVAMSYDHGLSICVSSQAGCKMNCAFCASAKGGFARNLTATEMLSQVLLPNSQRHFEASATHVVLMGMGEPLDNYSAVVKFVRHLKELLGISPRRVTLSTSGIVPQIYDLASEGLPLTLSVSLHAPNEELRTRLMPINKVYPLTELLPAMEYYAEKTGRRVSVEYTLIKGVNDSDDCAIELAALLGRKYHVNLIPVNPVEEDNWERPPDQVVTQFANILRRKGINVTVRRELGLDIDGSCGQLRRRS